MILSIRECWGLSSCGFPCPLSLRGNIFLPKEEIFSYSERKYSLIHQDLGPISNNCNLSLTLVPISSLISLSCPESQIVVSNYCIVWTIPLPAQDSIFPQRIAFFSYLWVWDLQILQFSSSKFSFFSVNYWASYPLILEDSLRTNHSFLCVCSSFIISEVHRNISLFLSDSSLLVLLEHFYRECFLILDDNYLLVSLTSESDYEDFLIWRIFW